MCGRSGDEKGVEAAEGDKKEATEKGSKKDFARRQQKRKGPPDLFLSGWSGLWYHPYEHCILRIILGLF